MTLQKPDEPSMVRRFMEDIKPAHLLMAVATCIGAYYGVQTQVAMLRQTQAEQATQIQQLNSAMDRKLDKEVYATQQQENHIELKGISDTVDRIEQFLMDHPRK